MFKTPVLWSEALGTRPPDKGVRIMKAKLS